MTTVRKLLETKASDTNFSIASTDTVLQAVKKMTEVHVGALLVTEGEKIVGIYTERDSPEALLALVRRQYVTPAGVSMVSKAIGVPIAPPAAGTAR